MAFFGIHAYQHASCLKPLTSQLFNTLVRAENKTKHFSVCSVLVYPGKLTFFCIITSISSLINSSYLYFIAYCLLPFFVDLEVRDIGRDDNSVHFVSSSVPYNL